MPPMPLERPSKRFSAIGRRCRRVSYRPGASGLLTLNTISISSNSWNATGKLAWQIAGTALRDGVGRLVMSRRRMPKVARLDGELERFIHDEPAYPADPLVKMAPIHHQFESIHPFLRQRQTAAPRTINVLYLVKEGLLDISVLYRSRHIVRTKPGLLPVAAGRARDRCWEDGSVHAGSRSQYGAKPSIPSGYQDLVAADQTARA